MLKCISERVREGMGQHGVSPPVPSQPASQSAGLFGVVHRDYFSLSSTLTTNHLSFVSQYGIEWLPTHPLSCLLLPLQNTCVDVSPFPTAMLIVGRVKETSLSCFECACPECMDMYNTHTYINKVYTIANHLRTRQSSCVLLFIKALRAVCSVRSICLRSSVLTSTFV